MKVIVDEELNTCVAGGVEILGLHATVAPRRQQTQAAPVLEQFQFVPYSDRLPANVELRQYADVCCSHAKQLLQTLSQANPNGALDQCMKTCNPPSQNAEVDGVALQLLKEMVVLSKGIDFSKNAQNLMDSRAEDLRRDELLSALMSPKALKTVVDVVLENYSRGPGHLKVIEYGSQRVFERVVPMMSTQPMLYLDYAVTGHGLERVPAERLQEMDVRSVPWTLEKAVPNGLGNADLLVLSHVLNNQKDLTEALKAFKTLVRPDGFLLVQEPTQHFCLPLALSTLAGDCADVADLPIRSCGPYCDAETWVKVFAEAGLEVVAQKDDQLLNTMFLCRVVPEGFTWPQQETVISVDDLSYQWVEEVKAAMACTAGEGQRIWVRSETRAHNGVVGMVNCLRQEDGGQRIR